MEVCVDSVISAVNAERGGADRIELCSALGLGGLTPSVGLLKRVKTMISIPVFVLIRPRSGDFLYDDEEIEVMKADIIVSKHNGADGIVVGALKKDGSVDADLCHQLVEISHPLPLTFHRAIDMSRDPLTEIDTVAALGFSRVLTSGACGSAMEGVSLIKQMVHRSQNPIIMPVSGLIEECLEMRKRAYCPYSNIHVGSVVETVDGAVYTGCNVENASYSMAICAERTAMVKAVSDGHLKFKRIIVVSDIDQHMSPCGACRQFMSEFGVDWDVYLTRPDKTFIVRSVSQLLPDHFIYPSM